MGRLHHLHRRSIDYHIGRRCDSVAGTSSRLPETASQRRPRRHEEISSALLQPTGSPAMSRYRGGLGALRFTSLVKLFKLSKANLRFDRTQPVLILRRIDTKTTVIGGGSLEPPQPNVVELSRLSVAPGERIGEPVSQYKNVAFEVYQASPTSRSDNPFDRRLPASSFLGCINDEIGIHVAEEEKTILTNEESLSPPPRKLPSPPSQLRNPLYASTNSYAPASSGFDFISEGSSDDSDSKRKRARTSTTMGFVPQAVLPPSPASNRPASRHKRRGQSLSSLATLGKSRSPSPRQGSDLVWTVPCGGESSPFSVSFCAICTNDFEFPLMRCQNLEFGPS